MHFFVTWAHIFFLLFLSRFEQQHLARHNAPLEFHEKEFYRGNECVSFKLVSSKMKIVFVVLLWDDIYAETNQVIIFF